MSQHQSNPTTTLVAGEALEANRYVTLDSSGEAVYADAGDDAQYATLHAAASGDPVTVRSLNAGGSVEITAAAAVTTLGADAYIRDNGTVSESSADSAVRKGVFKGTAAVGATVEVEIANI